MKNTYKSYNPIKPNSTIKSIIIVIALAIFALLMIVIFNLVI